MDSLGSEVSQKMRSAVKAKLIELGTGGSAGYIDDELPDYVMIMVANKRSKQQMIADLNLFLGSQTELFVTWLHEVLHKLQEVTLPGVAVHKSKRKAGEKEDAAGGKKDKKEKRKDKSLKKLSAETSGSVEKQQSPLASITDVVAGQLLEKAKTTLIAENTAMKSSKKEQIQPLSATPASKSRQNQGDDFDIPTITEISHEGPNPSHKSKEKDLAELAEIQKKIYETKKQLKGFDEEIEDENEGSAAESDDEDFLNIDNKEDGEEFEEESSKQKKSRPKSPIVFDKIDEPVEVKQSDQSDRRALRSGVQGTRAPLSMIRERLQRAKSPLRRPNISREGERFRERSRERSRDRSTGRNRERSRERPQARSIGRPRERSKERSRDSGKDLTPPPPKKRSIHERLGRRAKPIERNEIKVVNSSKEKATERVPNSTVHRRAEQEIYVPAFRRKEFELQTGRSRSRNRATDAKNGCEDDNMSTSKEKPNEEEELDDGSPVQIRRRIGSRVIVAPQKPELESEDEERTVNSVVTVKPRPMVSPSKQACKNLLLRAVAEAQRSTVLAKPKPEKLLRNRTPTPPPQSVAASARSQKLYTKSYRDRTDRDTLARRLPKENIVVHVKAANRNERQSRIPEVEEENNDEYIPEPVSDRGESDTDYVYIPQTINSGGSNDEEYEVYQRDVEEESNTQFVVTLDDDLDSKYNSRLLKKSRESSRKQNGKEAKRRASSREKSQSRNSTNSPSTVAAVTPAAAPPKKSELIEVYRKPKEVKKIIIQNDSDGDDIISPKKTPDKSAIRASVERSTTPPLDEIKSKSRSPVKRKRSPIKFDMVVNSKEAKRRSKSIEREKPPRSMKEIADADHEKHRILTKKMDIVKKYDNIPELLSSVSIDSSGIKPKSKDRCKFYPSCSKVDCEFFHPSAPCKAFPNCKFADKCLYIHPKCKFDTTCNKIGCNFSHSNTALPGQTAAPPLSSHVVPVQNYKTITATPQPAMCKFYPNCINTHCIFFHPKACRFGKNCNKIECNFYHQDVASKDKFKWVASVI